MLLLRSRICVPCWSIIASDFLMLSEPSFEITERSDMRSRRLLLFFLRKSTCSSSSFNFAFLLVSSSFFAFKSLFKPAVLLSQSFRSALALSSWIWISLACFCAERSFFLLAHEPSTKSMATAKSVCFIIVLGLLKIDKHC
ncbi:hypothetical protein D3C87_1616090 [compost metagenome]